MENMLIARGRHLFLAELIFFWGGVGVTYNNTVFHFDIKEKGLDQFLWRAGGRVFNLVLKEYIFHSD